MVDESSLGLENLPLNLEGALPFYEELAMASLVKKIKETL
jgi:hypothetical protein